MQEVEVKILEINKQELIEKLGHFGAEFVEQVKIHDKQFDFPDHRIKNADELFRLRAIGNRVEMTYKDGQKYENNFRIQEETQITVSDFATTEAILKKLGFVVGYNREKIRTSFKKGNVRFEIDQYPNIPPYIEMEGPQEEIKAAVEELGFSMADTTDMTATGVFKHYGLDPTFVTFDSSL